MNNSQSAGTFAGVCGTLAGFSMALIILILTPNMFGPSSQSIQDSAIALLFTGGAIYITSAGIFANAANDSDERSLWHYSVALTLFHIANTITVLSIVTVLQDFNLPTAIRVGWIVLIFTAVVAVINFMSMLISVLKIVRIKRQLSKVSTRTK